MKKAAIGLILTFIAIYSPGQSITVNQLGYYIGEVKLATVPGEENGNFTLVEDGTDVVVFTGTLGPAQMWAPANQSVRIADFTVFNVPGTYYIQIEGSTIYSHTFRIEKDIYYDLSKESLRFYYLSRVSMPIEEEYAGVYARAVGHPDTAVIIHASAASPDRPEGSTISTPRGWYDAGDYNKYVVNAGISNYTVFAIAEHYPEYAAKLDLNIPESDNDVPDIIDEAIYNLRWMLSMQDPNDGGVYHKCTEMNFCGMITPAQAATVPRYVVMKTTAATLDMAAVAAQASRILADYESEYPGLADSCLDAALYAYEWARANPAVYYQQPDNINTGEYRDGNVTDEFRWTAMELYITTGDAEYLSHYDYLDRDAYDPGWGSVYPLGLISLVRNADDLTGDVDMEAVEQKIIDYADSFYDNYQNSAYKVPAASFYWGSNGGVGNGALMSLQAYYITNEEKYKEAAIVALDYLLGRNPTLFSFVTNFGSHTPMHPHDRKSESDGIVDPLPGMLVGGPNPSNTDDCGSGAYPSTLPALCYYDNLCSYSTNEIAINWNAPLAYLSCAIQSYIEPDILEAYTGTTDSSLIFIKFDSDLDSLTLNPIDFSLKINEGVAVNITDIQLIDKRILQIILESSIAANDSNILFSYLPGTLTSNYGTEVDTITDHPVLNLVHGSNPVVVDAFTDNIENNVYLHFSKKMNDPELYLTDFALLQSGAELTLTSAELTDDDSLSVTFYAGSSLSYKDTLLFSYNGLGYIASDGGRLKKFDSLLIRNNLPTPSVLMNIEMDPGGQVLDLFFSKPLIDTSVHAEDFAFSKNDGQWVEITDTWLNPENDYSLIMEFTEAVAVEDTNLNIYYSGERLLSYQFVPVESFGPIPVTNTAAIPHTIPGIIEVEDYYRNVGYVFEDCTDEGGGLSLGYADVGDYIDYYVDVSESGLYTVTYRLATGMNGSQFEVLMPEDTPIDTVSVPSTGGWQEWQSFYSLVNINEGEQLLRIYTMAPPFNMNWFRFDTGNIIPPDQISLHPSASDEIIIYPNPVQRGNTLTIIYCGTDYEKLTITLYDLSGRKLSDLFTGISQPGINYINTSSIDPSFSCGIYLLKVKGNTMDKYIILRIQ